MNEYWSARVDAARNAAKGDVSIEDLPIRTNETSNAYSVRFNGVGDYPLYAYLHVPKSDGPHVPLFQAPGYGSVVAVPAVRTSGGVRRFGASATGGAEVIKLAILRGISWSADRRFAE